MIRTLTTLVCRRPCGRPPQSTQNYPHISSGPRTNVALPAHRRANRQPRRPAFLSSVVARTRKRQSPAVEVTIVVNSRSRSRSGRSARVPRPTSLAAGLAREARGPYRGWAREEVSHGTATDHGHGLHERRWQVVADDGAVPLFRRSGPARRAVQGPEHEHQRRRDGQWPRDRAPGADLSGLNHRDISRRSPPAVSSQFVAGGSRTRDRTFRRCPLSPALGRLAEWLPCPSRETSPPGGPCAC